ncbi:T9SS type A sorting domain-containing protein [Dyadobacter sp. CY261]|uniref:glycoside hydrolase family 44 protein n=1 Tax=Dyadobacter sp. CY261 TaxID=2907203 RepID=UPI001F3DB6B8|nr:glycoside hydrolase family 44 protein [Dyadobacter sp. CY261]MCF0069654.1 T9SS type A sorting domain-containing protein [Dyadobacter sp. CY261]
MGKPLLYLAKMCLVWAFMCCMSITVFAQNVTISVNATQDKRLISPNIYGRNEGFDKPDQFYKEAGLRFARIGGGNNMSAYNWRAKLAVHPDWFNNVYGADWDVYAQKVNSNFSNVQGMFAFQLLGRAASSGQNNFPDWNYMQANPGWFGNHQNLAGGGTPNPDSNGPALVEGNKDLFSKPWPADSSVGILNHWFGANGLGFNKDKFVYWSMDNEVDVWNGTHDWEMPTLISASAFMDRYIELAKKAKAIYPGIKLCGPVTTSEWQWYKWSNESIWIDGRYYPWIEYFIKRLGDEYKATGVKLVDVIDIHNYPWYNNDNAQALQGHRIYYDTQYDYPGSNGLKSSTGGWDNSLTKQYLFKRFDGWLNEHFGPNHGITSGVSEWSPGPDEPNLASVIYGSHLGTFANNGVELFSPWNWFTGMWETLHLFSRNAKKYSVASASSDENMVSAYSSLSETADSLTVMLINRDMAASRTVTINLSNFTIANGNYKTLRLASLPATETFVSDTQNALQESTVPVSSNSLTITVPALSTTAILLANESALPVNLISFSGKASSEGNLLLWSTAEEVNNEGFEVERSTNGVRFEKIGSVTGKGMTSARVDYQFVDKQPLLNAYYRLKQLDFDHTYSFSRTINVKNESGIKQIVYPNPVSGKLNFDVPPAKRQLVVRNMAGVVVDEKADFSATSYDTSHLPKGLYLISLGSYTFKVLVE